MIFRTIDNDLTGVTNKLGILKKSFSAIKRDLFNGQGILYSFFGSNTLTSNDALQITNYTNLLKSGVPTGRAWSQTMIGCSIAAKQHVLECKNDITALEALSTTTKTMTISAKAGQVVLKGLAIAGNILAICLTTKLVQGLYELSQVSKTVAKNAQGIGEVFNSAKSDLSSYREKVEALQKTIRDSSSSVEEVTEARKSLLSIQDELIEKYGTEKEAIVNISLALDSNTDSIDKNAATWERLTDVQWQAQKNKFNDGGFWNDMGNMFSGYADNVDRMVAEYGNYKVNISVGETSGLNNRKEIEEILKQFGNLDYTDAGIAQIELKGNATDVYEQLLKIQKKVNDIEGDYTSNFTKALTKMANEAYDVSEKYKDYYDAYLLQEKIFPNDTYVSILNDLANAYNIDDHQTAAKGLKEAMDSYKNTGVISIDQLQSILSYGDEYLKYITDENGNLVLNEQAIKNVTQARLEEWRAKTLENLLSNLENIDNEATAQAFLESQVLKTAESYKDLTVAKIEMWRGDNLLKAQNGETDLTVSTINEVADMNL